MTPTSAAASYLARFFGQDAVTIQSNPGGRGEAVEVRWNGGLATIHPAPRAMYSVNCALAREECGLLSLPDAVERMITRAIANAN